MIDSDLEELESHLYSQVYHSSVDDSENQNLGANSTFPVSIFTKMRKPGNRYFGPWSPASKNQKKFSPYKPNSIQAQSSTPSGFYSKKVGNFRKAPGVQFNQVVVVTQNHPILCLPPQESRKSSKRRKRERYKERKRQRQLLEIQREWKVAGEPPQVPLKRQTDKNNDVITLSDSENDDSCILIESKLSPLKVESDKHIERQSTSTPKSELKQLRSPSDDVIFVEPETRPIETINLDDEPEVEKNIETASTTPSDVITPTKQLHQERKELLSTPDSASNDFMNNSGIELQKKTFNFSLHGSDFHGGEFLKPGARNEACETESSSSTTDANSVNLMKTIVFNEVDFPRDDIFSGGSLESFGNFITPLRSHSAPPEGNDDGDNFGSNSNEEEIESNRNIKTRKSLPELSPMLASSVTSTAKKSKKASNLCSKYDLLTSPVESVVKELERKDVKKKKRKNKKKRNSSLEPETPGNVNPTDDVKDQLKQKKRRSNQMEEGENCENQSKRRIVTSENSESLESSGSERRVCQENPNIEQNTIESDLMDTKIVNENKNKKKDVTAKEVQKYSDLSVLENLIILDETVCGTSDIESESPIKAVKNLPSSSMDLLTCDVKDLQKRMPGDPKLWQILQSDISPSGRKGRRCTRCRQFGHLSYRCTNRLEPKCRLCAEKGHFEPRCPNKLCTQCGRHSFYLTTYCQHCSKFKTHQCRICSIRGHSADFCPDLWRRYHLTIKEGPPKTNTDLKVKETKDLWCSGCAKSGHLEHSCSFYKSNYPPSNPYVIKYDDVYDKNSNFNSNTKKKEEEKRPPPPPVYRASPNYFQNEQIPVRQNQNAYFGQMDNRFMNPWAFVPRQPNYFPQFNSTLLQLPQNNSGQFNFQVLPSSYIDFTQPGGSYGEAPSNQNFLGSNFSPPKQNAATDRRDERRNNEIFFSASTRCLQQFVSSELQRLSKMEVMSDKMLHVMRRTQPPRPNVVSNDYYETLNMLLFGVFNMFDGKAHLDRLKNFKHDVKRIKEPIRRRLLESYNYIFGRGRRYGVDYNELLRRI